MKILHVGAHGTIGSQVAEELRKRHEVICAGRTSGDCNVNIESSQSIEELFDQVGKVDAILSTAGQAKWDFLNSLSEEDFQFSIRSKLMGQVNLVRIGKEFLNDRGSVTLTTGILADEPVEMTAAAALVNGGIHSFVKAASLELTRDLRVNAVAVGLVEASADKYRSYFPGYNPVPMSKVVNAYLRAIEGRMNGMVIREY